MSKVIDLSTQVLGITPPISIIEPFIGMVNAHGPSPQSRTIRSLTGTVF